MAFEVVPPSTAEIPSCASPPGSNCSSNEIDRLLSEILNDPNVFSLIDSSPASSSSSAPSPPCQTSTAYSPSPQQLEQEALASLQHQQQQLRRPQTLSRDQERCCVAVATETPSPCTPSSSTDDQTAFFPPSPLSYPTSHATHHHPSSLPIYPTPTQSPNLSPFVQPPPHPSPSSHVLENVEVCVSCNFGDPLLRGSSGRIVSIEGGNLFRVLLYGVNQECTIPVSFLEFMNPRPGDMVRVIQGNFSGATAILLNTIANYSNIQLLTGAWTQIETLNIAKLAVGTPLATPTSPHPLQSPTSPLLAASPTLLSPASVQFPGFPSPGSSYPPSPTTLHSFPPPGYNRPPAYYQASHARPIRRRSICVPTQTGTGTSLARQFNLSNMSDLQRQRFLRQHRDVAQRRLQLLRTNSNNSQNRLSSADNRSVIKTDSSLKSLEKPTQELLDELKERKKVEEYDFGSTGDGGDLSSNCIQVPLTCPISQRRMTLPCRGDSCKHPQCFDAEAYIEYNKCVLRPKDKKCQSTKTKQQLFKCPLCSKSLPFYSLYIDKTLLEILKETDVDEVEFDKTGSWKPVEKKSEEDVIDLTLEEDKECNPSP